MAELNARWLATMLAADPHLERRSNRFSLPHCDFHQSANSFTIEDLKWITFVDVALDVGNDETP